MSSDVSPVCSKNLSETSNAHMQNDFIDKLIFFFFFGKLHNFFSANGDVRGGNTKCDVEI